MVIALVEVSGHFGFLWFMGDLVEMRLKPLLDIVFCLAYILFPARAARDAIHNVIAEVRTIAYEAVGLLDHK